MVAWLRVPGSKGRKTNQSIGTTSKQGTAQSIPHNPPILLQPEECQVPNHKVANLGCGELILQHTPAPNTACEL